MQKLTMGLMVVLCALWAGAVWAHEKGDHEEDFVPVPQTGQVLCYDAVGTIISCSGTGQDGAIQAGVELPRPRFTDKGNGTFKDNLTGLIWLKNANCPGSARTWQQALNDVASLNTTGKMNGNDCGDKSGKRESHRTDWRLPNIRELLSLVDYAFSNPALSNSAGVANGTHSDPFSNLQALFFQAFYWSSTTFVSGSISSGPFGAWVLDFFNGFAGFDDKSFTDFVVAVRRDSED